MWMHNNIFLLHFFFLLQREKLRNSSTILVFLKVLKTQLWEAGAKNI